MTRDSVRTEVSDDGRVVYLLSVRDDRAQEFIPAGAVADGTSGSRFEDYTLPEPFSIGRPRLVSVRWGCHVGDQFGTLLAPDRRMYQALTPRIASSELLGTADVDGARCAVIRWDAPPEPDGFLQGATYYIDLSTGWMRRNDRYQAEGSRRDERVSLYKIEPADPPAGIFELQPK